MAVPPHLGEEFETVLASAQQAEQWALGHLYETLQPSVLAYLRSQDADAEDIAADAWIDAARGLNRFEGGEADSTRRAGARQAQCTRAQLSPGRGRRSSSSGPG